jgi:hypothetical protein
MAIPGFTAGLSLELGITLRYVVKEYEPINDKLLLAQRDLLICLNQCTPCIQDEDESV